MFPNGLSLIIHLLIISLVALKRLVELVADKMRWDVFKFKLNLYLRLKVTAPITGQKGDSPWRQALSYALVLTIFSLIFFAATFFLISNFKASPNMDFLSRLFSSQQTTASQYREIYKQETPFEGYLFVDYAARLPKPISLYY